MKAFAALVSTLEQTIAPDEKTAALAAYFRAAPETDRIWAIALMSGRRPRRAVPGHILREWAAERAGIPMWLFEVCYPLVGDLAETLTLVLPEPAIRTDRSLSEWVNILGELGTTDMKVRKPSILMAWDVLPLRERFVFNKLVLGGWRMGVSSTLLISGLSQATGVAKAELTHRLKAEWSPAITNWVDLIESNDPGVELSHPFPNSVTRPLDMAPEDLGDVKDWFVERKWDGLRSQLILRGGESFLWSGEEALMTDCFPEFAQLVDFIPPGTVLDGAVLAFDVVNDAPLSPELLHRRIGRKTVSKKLLKDTPCILMAFDILESHGTDIRQTPLVERREVLAGLIANLPPELPIRMSQNVHVDTWDKAQKTHANSRAKGVNGLMLKLRSAPYPDELRGQDWWHWNARPLTIDAVLTYAQAADGGRTSPFTEFTFAVWAGNELVPVAKANCGLLDTDFDEISDWVRKNTTEKFGPVRAVIPHHVFDLAFEGIEAAPRRKSGVTLRAPMIRNWRKGVSVDQASSLDDINRLLAQFG